MATVDDHFWKPNRKMKSRNMGRKELISKWIEKPLSPSGRNNGLQVHKINKWALRK